MHGGAKGSGAPKNNKNVQKHGGYTREALRTRTAQRAVIKEAEKLLKELELD